MGGDYSFALSLGGGRNLYDDTPDLGDRINVFQAWRCAPPLLIVLTYLHRRDIALPRPYAGKYTLAEVKLFVFDFSVSKAETLGDIILTAEFRRS